MRLDHCYNIADLRQAAKTRAHKMVFDYIDGGSDDEQTLNRNSSVYSHHHLMHRSLTGVADPDMSVELFGHQLEVPFFFSPAAGQRLFHTQGELGGATIAKELGTAFCLSTLSSISIEDVAKIGPDARWFQLYVWKDRALVKAMLDRAKAAGFTTLILTVDFPVTGNRERDLHNGLTIPPKTGFKQAIEALRHPAWTKDYVLGPKIKYANLDDSTPAVSLTQFVAEQLDATFDWSDAEWLLGEWNGPAIIKGLMHPSDVKRAKGVGFNGIMISNHGGRQLDGEAAPLDVVGSFKEQTQDDLTLILDGGVRRGTDILKALCLGADAVSFARPYLYGLAAGGIPGVRRAGRIMKDEVKRAMILAGWQSLKQASPSELL